MFKIKICGVTTVQDAIMAARTGANAIGLNFYPKSKRYLPVDQAKEICAALQDLEQPPQTIGVFVNETASRIREIAEQTKLDAVQLHGDEPPSLLASLEGLAVVKAFRYKNQMDPVVDWIHAAKTENQTLRSVLLDAYHPDEFGGTGKSIDLDKIRDQVRRLDGIHWVLAGGLRPENVGAAIRSIFPSAVDTASGVESAPGQKCPAKTERFVREAEVAFAKNQNGT